LDITQEQNAAAGDLVDLIAAKVGEDRALHPETAISASARLSGSLLLRSFNLDLSVGEPGSVLLSNEANEKGPVLINIVGGFLSASNIQLDKEKIGGEDNHRGETPRIGILDALSLLQQDAINICKCHSLDMGGSATAAALATAFVIKECAPQIGAETAFNVAVYGFIEGSKTIPPNIDSEQVAEVAKKPWYKFW